MAARVRPSRVRPSAATFELETGGATDLDTPLLEPEDDGVPIRVAVKLSARLKTAIVALLACLAVYIGALFMVGRPYGHLCGGVAGVCGYRGCLGGKEFAGVILASVALTCSVLPLGWISQQTLALYRGGHLSVFGMANLLSAYSALCFVVVVLCFVFLLKPWVVFTTPASMSPFGWGWKHYGVIACFFGGVTLLLYLFMAVTLAVVAFRLHPKTSGFSPWRRSGAPLEPRRLADNACGIVVVVLVLVLSFVAACLFGPSLDTHVLAYTSAPSTESIVSWRLSNKFVTKLFPDVLTFYVVMLVMVGLAVASQFTLSVRRVMATRLRVPGSPNWPLHPFPTGVSVGELLVVALVVFLYAFWLWYWRWSYTRIVDKAKDDPHASYQIWARVLGHWTSLSFALLLLPVTRNSMWEHVFGMPFERAIKYHRFIARVAYGCVTAHMLAWMSKWGLEGNLGHNLTSFNELRVAPTNFHYDPSVNRPCVGSHPFWNDFTVVLSFYGWILLTVMLVLALHCRRRNYELFYYTHHFAWLYYLIALMHAWSFWYYAMGGLLLYTLDRCLRFGKGLSASAVVSLNASEGVTQLVLPGTTFRHYAGQYAFVNIPAVSTTQWHPFTISSAPSAPHRTFHIKDMGDNTWTGQLAALAKRQVMTEVRVDAAYGRAGYFTDHQALLLIAGGIGITPMHSVFAELHAAAVAASLPGSTASAAGIGNLTRVHLVWSARSPAVLSLFSPTFHAVARKNPGSAFHVSLHNTRPHAVVSPSALSTDSSLGDISVDAIQYAQSVTQDGRPNYSNVFRDLAARFQPQDVMVMVCGPRPLVTTASNLSFKFGFSFHSEVFEF